MKLLIVDHEGVLTCDSGRTLQPADWKALPGAPEALGRLAQAGWRLVLLADRAAVTRGACDLATLNAVHSHMISLLASAGAPIELVLFAPPPDGPDRAARLAASLQDLLMRLDTPPHQTTLVADTLDELNAAHTLGCQPVLVLTGRGRATFEHGGLPPDTQVRVDLNALALDGAV